MHPTSGKLCWRMTHTHECYFVQSLYLLVLIVKWSNHVHTYYCTIIIIFDASYVYSSVNVCNGLQ